MPDKLTKIPIEVLRFRIALGVTVFSPLVMGGVSLIVHPELGIGYTLGTMFAPAFLGICEMTRLISVEIINQIQESKRLANVWCDSIIPPFSDNQ
jgi:galactitol-specific phosphotransferase system IIC component